MSGIILACFRHTSDTAGHSELSSIVILQCNVFCSVNLQDGIDIQEHAIYEVVSKSRPLCAIKTGWPAPF